MPTLTNDMKREIILEHYSTPDNKQTPDDKTKYKAIRMDSDSCIDDITIYLDIENDVIKDIDTIRGMLDFELQIISFEKNMGLSNARNVGYAISKYNHVIFMDSDIILSKNYIYDMSIRLQMIPNAIFICCFQHFICNHVINFSLLFV